MSGTTRTAEAAQPATEGAAASTGQATSVRNGADRSKPVVHAVSETVAQTVDTAAVMSSKVVDETLEAMLIGLRTAADVGGRVAQIGRDRSHHLMASAARSLDIYRDASERSAEGVQALFSSWMAAGRGFQQMQHEWLQIFDHFDGSHRPQAAGSAPPQDDGGSR